MNETKIDWSDLQNFLAVARGGGLAGGAAISGLSAPTLGRHMLALERALGEVLFERLPRGYDLTQAGKELLEQASNVEARVFDIERRRRATNTGLPIHISAGTWMTRFLCNGINAIRVPGSRLVFRSAEAQHNIERREATIGLRNRRPNEDNLAARKSTRIAFAPYATPEARTNDDWVASTTHSQSANWVRAQRGEQIRVEVSSPRSLLDLLRQGVGQGVLPCFVGDAEPRLVRSGPIISALTHEQWLVVHNDDRHVEPVRQTVDLIAALIRANRAAFEGVTDFSRDNRV